MAAENNILLPEQFRKYFWDVDSENLEVNHHLFYVTERILEYGNSESLKWLLSIINFDFIKTVITENRTLSKRTINYWKTILVDE